jgi:hypothetical protein
MSHLVHLTLSDLRGGRQTWRVFLLVCTPAFVAACLAAALVQ